MDLDKYKYPVPAPPNMNPSFINEQQKYLSECNKILMYLNENTGTNNGIWFFENIAAIFSEVSVSVLDKFIFPKIKVDGFITILNGVFAPSSVNAKVQFKISDEGRVFIASGGYAVTNPKSLKDFTIELLQLLDEKGQTVEASDFIYGFHKQNNIDTADIKFKLDALKRDGIITIIGHEFLAASKGFSSIQKDSIHASITIKGEEYLKSLSISSRIINSASNANSNMYYQIIIDLQYFVSFPGKSSGYLYEFDLTDLNGIERDRMMPYLKNQKFIVGGRELCKEEIDRFIVLKSNNTTTENIKLATKNNPNNVITKSDILAYTEYYTDITSEVHNRVQQKVNSEDSNISMMKNSMISTDRTSVFIVHGHDSLAKIEVARFIEKLGFAAIILHEQVSAGKTIIEKIEANSNVGFGIVLYTPCDIGAVKEQTINLQPRARQNVVFEHGYLIGKLGRHNVCALVKGEVEKPKDIDGVVYVEMDSHNGWQTQIAREMKECGYPVDMNKL